MNSTRAFVDHALSTSFENIPAEAIEAAKTYILDTLGVGVAGKNAVLADEIFGAVKNWGESAGGAHVFGRGIKLPTPNAAFVNGFQIHCQEYDCVHEPAVVHPMATIFSALMADTEARGGVSGKAFLAAIVVAVDVAAGLGVAAKSGIRFFRPANAGIFGATLGIAKLRGFDAQTSLDALGYALAFCSGTMQAHVEGKPALPVQIGNAARGAVAACDLAAAGVPGPNDVFDGPFGYLELFETESEIAPIVNSLGKTWRIAEVSHKPFPTGRAAQGGIVAVQQLRAQGLTPENMDTLTLTAPPLIHRLVGRPYRDEMTANYARLCFAFSGAIALIDGSVGLHDFSERRLSDKKIAEVASRIKVIDDQSPDPAAFTPQRAVATTKNGDTFETEITELYGSPNNPMSKDAHLQKFRQCIAFGFDQEAETRASELIDLVDKLETQSDAAAMSRMAAGLRE